MSEATTRSKCSGSRVESAVPMNPAPPVIRQVDMGVLLCPPRDHSGSVGIQLR
ncbi:hypothetical protein ACFPRL_11450 [Pseudoclavibacter helvolus]